MTSIRFEWRDDGIAKHRDVLWLSVPREGEHVCIDDETGEGYTVKVVLWGSDGTAAVRLQ